MFYLPFSIGKHAITNNPLGLTFHLGELDLETFLIWPFRDAGIDDIRCGAIVAVHENNEWFIERRDRLIRSLVWSGVQSGRRKCKLRGKLEASSLECSRRALSLSL